MQKAKKDLKLFYLSFDHVQISLDFSVFWDKLRFTFFNSSKKILCKSKKREIDLCLQKHQKPLEATLRMKRAFIVFISSSSFFFTLPFLFRINFQFTRSFLFHLRFIKFPFENIFLLHFMTKGERDSWGLNRLSGNFEWI